MRNRLISCVVGSALMAGCQTTANVEDADLFGAGNIKRYKREQAEREAYQTELEAESTTLQGKLGQKKAVRAELQREEVALKADLAKQQGRIDALERDIDAARRQRRINDSQRQALLSEVSRLKLETQRVSNLNHMTSKELSEGRATKASNEQRIAQFENLRSLNFRNVSEFLAGQGN